MRVWYWNMGRVKSCSLRYVDILLGHVQHESEKFLRIGANSTVKGSVKGGKDCVFEVTCENGESSIFKLRIRASSCSGEMQSMM